MDKIETFDGFCIDKCPMSVLPKGYDGLKSDLLDFDCRVSTDEKFIKKRATETFKNNYYYKVKITVEAEKIDLNN